jgi:NADH-quinone oxidoreductase subunit F
MTKEYTFVPGPAADKTHIVYNADGLKRESSAPCQIHCPAGIDIPSFIALIGQERFDEAVSVIRQDNPFPWVCGLICPNPCEAWCQRRHLDKALCIKDLKAIASKLVVDEYTGYGVPKPKASYQEKIAVIGSGPAGLSAAYFLAWEGYKVTVFETLQEPGGMLVTGIPEYRLPRHIVKKEIQAIQNMGVEIKCDTPIGTDLTLDDLRKDGYKAFFLGIGAWESSRLQIEGEKEFPQVIDVLTFLKNVAFGYKVRPAERVAIIGGGNAAVDAARTCIRLGCASVSILYRRTRSEMPAHFEEIIQAAEEGIHFHQLTIPIKIHGSYGKVDSLECMMASLGDPDETGRRRPVPIPDSNYKMQVGAIISAIGQLPHVGDLPGLGNLELSKRNTIKVALKSLRTNLPDVYAGGDAVSGPKTVVDAIGTGKQAALAIHSNLQGHSNVVVQVPSPRRMVAPIRMNYNEKAFIQRQEIPLIDLNRRTNTFDQVELGLDRKSAVMEAKRCLRCDVCERCGKCVEACATVVNEPAIKFFHAGESSLVLKDYVHGLPHCIGCGTCANICPTGALQVEDHGDERLLLMCGTVINRIKMETCSQCGIPFSPKIFLRHLAHKLGDLSQNITLLGGHLSLCPDCRRSEHAHRMNQGQVI